MSQFSRSLSDIKMVVTHSVNYTIQQRLCASKTTLLGNFISCHHYNIMYAHPLATALTGVAFLPSKQKNESKCLENIIFSANNFIRQMKFYGKMKKYAMGLSTFPRKSQTAYSYMHGYRWYITDITAVFRLSTIKY